MVVRERLATVTRCEEAVVGHGHVDDGGVAWVLQNLMNHSEFQPVNRALPRLPAVRRLVDAVKIRDEPVVRIAGIQGDVAHR